MSGKQVTRYARYMRRKRDKLIVTHVEMIFKASLWERVKFAVVVLRGGWK